MRLYSCKVRLDGNVANEVPKVATAAEILVWQWLHGPDAVVNIKHYDDDASITNKAEREKLKQKYDQYLQNERGGRNPTSIDQMFGTFNALPNHLPDFEDDEFDFDDEEDVRAALEAKARKTAAKQTRPAQRGRQTVVESQTVPAPVEIVDA